MRSEQRGKGTSGVELVSIRDDAVVYRIDGEQFVLGFGEFPWFEGAGAGDLERVDRPTDDHLYWPALDVDLTLESLRHPERFPLVSKG